MRRRRPRRRRSRLAAARRPPSLHHHPRRSIPWENLSLHIPAAAAQHPITTDLPSIYRKLVLAPRGGWCYEQNGLLAAVLRSLGFELFEAGARVVQREPPPPPASPPLEGVHAPAPRLALSGHDHRVVIVRLEGGGLWLADVGFCGEVPLPLPLPPRAEAYPPTPEPPPRL